MIVAKISIFLPNLGVFEAHLCVYLNRGKRTNSQKLFYQAEKWVRFFHLTTWYLSYQKMPPISTHSIHALAGWLLGVYCFFYFCEKHVAQLMILRLSGQN